MGNYPEEEKSVFEDLDETKAKAQTSRINLADCSHITEECRPYLSPDID